jgi:hypothetical protein
MIPVIRLEKTRNLPYSGDMKMKPAMQGFSKGMKCLTFFPNIPQRNASPASAWVSVGRAFQYVGDNIKKAMYEQPKPTRKTTK